MDWMLPESGIIWRSFDTGVGKCCCGEQTSGGILLCRYIVHPCVSVTMRSFDFDVGNFLLMMKVKFVEDV